MYAKYSTLNSWLFKITEYNNFDIAADINVFYVTRPILHIQIQYLNKIYYKYNI